MNLHKEYEKQIIALNKIADAMLREGVKLSKKEHRGRMCRKCRRPEATKLAYEELTRDGDGPDLCWGYC